MEICWSIFCDSKPTSFFDINERFADFLIKRKVRIQSFDHFGLVVNKIENSSKLIEIESKSLKRLKREWIECFKVYVTRLKINDKELEFIEPIGDSFFNSFLKVEGEGLHHVAYKVYDLKKCLHKLSLHGVKIINNKPCIGLHGLVAFLLPELCGQVCIELFQKI